MTTPQEKAREKAEQIVRANHARTWTAYMKGPAAAAACNDDALVADITAAILEATRDSANQAQPEGKKP